MKRDARADSRTNAPSLTTDSIPPSLTGLDDAISQSGCYLIHFLSPYRHARHYLGWSADVVERISRHRAGNGARLMTVVHRARIDWLVVRYWPSATRDDERRLKRRGGHARICPVCRAARRRAR